MCPHTGKARKKILVLGKFHLCTGMGSAGSPCKNIKYEVCPVKDPAAKFFFYVPQLAGGELIIKNGNIDIFFPHILCYFQYLTRADKGPGIWNIKLLDKSSDRSDSGCFF